LGKFTLHRQGGRLNFGGVKKILSILILAIYLTVSTGFVVSLHYCMDRVDSVELGTMSNVDQCHKCGMVHNSCCGVEVKLVRLPLTHNLPVQQKAMLALPVCFLSSVAFCAAVEHEVTVPEPRELYFPDHPPIFLKNRVFRL
jgi:hypothetical protein